MPVRHFQFCHCLKSKINKWIKSRNSNAPGRDDTQQQPYKYHGKMHLQGVILVEYFLLDLLSQLRNSKKGEERSDDQ